MTLNSKSSQAQEGRLRTAKALGIDPSELPPIGEVKRDISSEIDSASTLFGHPLAGGAGQLRDKASAVALVDKSPDVVAPEVPANAMADNVPPNVVAHVQPPNVVAPRLPSNVVAQSNVPFNFLLSMIEHAKGNLFRSFGDWKAAAACFEAAARIDQTDPYAFLRLAQCQAMMSHSDEARSNFEKALHLMPSLERTMGMTK